MRKVPIIIGAVLTLASITFAASSISYYGITWTFSADRTTGTFANGEPWVVGPVTITNIDPNPSQSAQDWVNIDKFDKNSPLEPGVEHGSMINPVPNTNFGFDNHAGITRDIIYESALNVALHFPFNLKAGDVLVSAKSQGTDPTWLKTVCALTVLGSPPPDSSFRPGIWGGDRMVKWNARQLNWSVLKNFPKVAYIPTKADITAKVPALPWFEWADSWSGNNLQPTDNTADGNKQYGREIAKKFGRVCLWLNTDQPLADKRAIAIQMVQNGIDIFEYVQHGGGFTCDGGHKCGRKLPLVLAAMMLNDSELKVMAGNPNIFQEDQQTWFVNQGDVNRIVYDPVLQGLCDSTKYTPQQMEAAWCGREFLRYRTEDVGQAEWGIRHSRTPFEDNASWSAGYRDVVGAGMRGAWLAAHIMGAQSVWNWPVAFAYMDRFIALTGFELDYFENFMCKKYRNVSIRNSIMDGAVGERAVQVSPNPMRDRAVFTLPEKSGANAQVKILGRDGRVVRSVRATGQSPLQWDGTNQAGLPVVPGVYYYTVTMDSRQSSGRIMVLPQDKVGR